jgi:ribosomal protein S25
LSPNDKEKRARQADDSFSLERAEETPALLVRLALEQVQALLPIRRQEEGGACVERDSDVAGSHAAAEEEEEVLHATSVLPPINPRPASVPRHDNDRAHLEEYTEFAGSHAGEEVLDTSSVPAVVDPLPTTVTAPQKPAHTPVPVLRQKNDSAHVEEDTEVAESHTEEEEEKEVFDTSLVLTSVDPLPASILRFLLISRRHENARAHLEEHTEVASPFLDALGERVIASRSARRELSPLSTERNSEIHVSPIDKGTHIQLASDSLSSERADESAASLMQLGATSGEAESLPNQAQNEEALAQRESSPSSTKPTSESCLSPNDKEKCAQQAYDSFSLERAEETPASLVWLALEPAQALLPIRRQEEGGACVEWDSDVAGSYAEEEEEEVLHTTSVLPPIEPRPASVPRHDNDGAHLEAYTEFAVSHSGEDILDTSSVPAVVDPLPTTVTAPRKPAQAPVHVLRQKNDSAHVEEDTEAAGSHTEEEEEDEDVFDTSLVMPSVDPLPASILRHENARAHLEEHTKVASPFFDALCERVIASRSGNQKRKARDENTRKRSGKAPDHYSPSSISEATSRVLATEPQDDDSAASPGVDSFGQQLIALRSCNRKRKSQETPYETATKWPRKAPNRQFPHSNSETEANALWTTREDILLRMKQAVRGLKWHEIATFVPGWSANACRLRFKKLEQEAGQRKLSVRASHQNSSEESPRTSDAPKGSSTRTRSMKDRPAKASAPKAKQSPVMADSLSERRSLRQKFQVKLGTRIGVYWGEKWDWCDGEVVKVKDDHVHVAYDDGDFSYVFPDKAQIRPAKAMSPKAAKQNQARSAKATNRSSKKSESSKKPPAKGPKAKPRKARVLSAVPFEKRISKKVKKPRWTPETLALVRGLDWSLL